MDQKKKPIDLIYPRVYTLLLAMKQLLEIYLHDNAMIMLDQHLFKKLCSEQSTDFDNTTLPHRDKYYVVSTYISTVYTVYLSMQL